MSKYICTCFYGALWEIHNGDKIFALLQNMVFLSETWLNGSKRTKYSENDR